jgi:hypothetical protein
MSAAVVLVALLAVAQEAGPAARDRSDAGIAAEVDAGTRPEADGGTERLPPQQASAELAKKTVDVTNIELQSARLYVLGLFHLARKPTTVFDRAHSVTLFNQAEQALGEVDRSVAELSGMARDKWQKAALPLTHARSTMAQVHKDLRSISVPPLGKETVDAREVTKRVFGALQSVRNDLESAAKEMGADPKLHEP